MNLNLPQDFKIVDAATGPVTTNGGITGAYVSLANALRAWLVVTLNNAVGFAEVISLTQAQALVGTGVKAGPNSRIWLNEDTAASDTLVDQGSAAAAVTTAAVAKKKLVVIEVEPAAFDSANGFDCAGWTASNSSQATDFAGALWVIQERYVQATPPSAVVD